jgi:hypothetical protein
MSSPDDYASFLLRCWHETGATGEMIIPGWHVEIENIQSGDKYSFDHLEDLLVFLQRNLPEINDGLSKEAA